MKHLKSILTLFIICAVVSILLAVVNGVTAPIIAEQQAAAASGALLEVMPNGGTFEKVDISSYSLPTSVTEVNKASNGGYVFQVVFSGYNTGNVAMIGVSADGKVTGTKCITVADQGGNGKDSAKEIPTIDATGYYVGQDATTIEGVDTIAGVTMSTKAYRSAVKDALNAALILGGGEVDLRTPEQILNDNLNEALGTEGVEFDKHFFVEVVEGVDAIYVAKNGEGYVVAIGEEFIGIDAEGKTVGDTNEVAEVAVSTIKATTSIELDRTGVSSSITSIKLTNDGIYVIEINGEGYGMNAPHGGSGKYIVIRVSITADGKILDCKTVSQKETSSFGGPCANEEFYGQFVGKTQGDYTDIRTDIDLSMDESPDAEKIAEDRKNYVADIDAISGATVTSAGYKAAIMKAFEAVKFFEGGAK